MSRFDSPLSNIKIASPCAANWDEMYGDEQKRFCGDCKLNVYNLSGMSKSAAENLLMETEGRLCVRYYKRADGTILTADCPVGWEMVKRRLSVCTTAIFSLVISLLTGLFFVSLFSKQTKIGVPLPIPFATSTPHDVPTMGAIAMPISTSNPPASPKNIEVMGEIIPNYPEDKGESKVGKLSTDQRPTPKL